MTFFCLSEAVNRTGDTVSAGFLKHNSKYLLDITHFSWFNRAMNNLAVDFFKNIPQLNKDYTTPEMRKKAVVILGSSRTTEPLLEYMQLCSETTKELVKNGFNIVTGCGSNGIMGAAYNAAKENSAINLKGKPIQNLAIIVNPLWGDENLKDCIIIGKASSEAERIIKFTKVADCFIFFPGGTTTLQEAATIIRYNVHNEENKFKKIILVGKEYFDGMKKQYETMAKMKFLKKVPDYFFKILSEKNEIINAIIKR